MEKRLYKTIFADKEEDKANIIEPTGSKTITANGNDIDVKEYATVDVNVSGEVPDLNFATVTVKTAAGRAFVYNSIYYADTSNPPRMMTEKRQVSTSGYSVKIGHTNSFQSVFYGLIVAPDTSTYDKIVSVSGNTGGTAKAITGTLYWFVPVYEGDTVIITLGDNN